MKNYQNDQRRLFADEIHATMKSNDTIYVLTGDFGYRMWDQVRDDYPERYYNVGAGEQALIGIGIGLALEKKIPIIYTATPFLLYRPFETIRNYVEHEQIPVKLVSSGRNRDYFHEGFSHWAEEDRRVMNLFPHITSCWPKTVEDVSRVVPKMLKDNKPWYINLRRL